MSPKRRIPWWRWLKSPWLRRGIVLLWVATAVGGLCYCWVQFPNSDFSKATLDVPEPDPTELPVNKDGELRAFRHIPAEKTQFAVNAAYCLMALVILGLVIMFALIIIYWEPPSTAVQIVRSQPLKRGKNYLPYVRPKKDGNDDDPEPEDDHDDEMSSSDVAENYLKRRHAGLPPIPLDEGEWDQ